MSVLSITVELRQFTCGKCGGVYALAERYCKNKEDEGGGWHCPYCECSWGYWKSEKEKLREKLEAEMQARQAAEARVTLEAAQRKAAESAAKKAQTSLKRVKHRVANGTCPCCQRSFVNLQRHMATKHPDYEGTPA